MRWFWGKDKRGASSHAEERAFIEAINSLKSLQATPRGGMRIDPEELRDQILDARERYKAFVQR